TGARHGAARDLRVPRLHGCRPGDVDGARRRHALAPRARRPALRLRCRARHPGRARDARPRRRRGGVQAVGDPQAPPLERARVRAPGGRPRRRSPPRSRPSGAAGGRRVDARAAGGRLRRRATELRSARARARLRRAQRLFARLHRSRRRARRPRLRHRLQIELSGGGAARLLAGAAGQRDGAPPLLPSVLPLLAGGAPPAGAPLAGLRLRPALRWRRVLVRARDVAGTPARHRRLLRPPGARGPGSARASADSEPGGSMKTTRVLDLEQAQQLGVFTPLDLQFARYLGQLAGEQRPEALLVAALVSRRTREGHVCVDLERFAGTRVSDARQELVDGLLWPKLDALLGAVADCPLVGAPETNTPLVSAGKRLYLRRYFEHEAVLSSAVRQRLRRSEEELFAGGPADIFARLLP